MQYAIIGVICGIFVIGTSLARPMNVMANISYL